MGLRISHREVLENLIRLKDSLQEKKNRMRKSGAKQRIYPALVDLSTGNIRLAQTISALESEFPRKIGKRESYVNWKTVHLIVSQEEDEKLLFSLCDEKNVSLKASDFNTSVAWEVIAETLRVLNTIAKVQSAVSGTRLPEEIVLSSLNFSTIEMAPSQDQIKDLPEWAGRLERLEAEQRLKDKPLGAYLLRMPDEPLKAALFLWKKSHVPSFLQAYLLTAVGEGGKILDILLLQTKRGWTFCSDDQSDVDLNSGVYTYYRSLPSLISSIFPPGLKGRSASRRS
jgi:hypothetical protein